MIDSQSKKREKAFKKSLCSKAPPCAKREVAPTNATTRSYDDFECNKTASNVVSGIVYIEVSHIEPGNSKEHMCFVVELKARYIDISKIS